MKVTSACAAPALLGERPHKARNGALSLAVASVLTVLLVPRDTRGADAGVAQARLKFQQGLALETAGDWTGALALFQQVAAVRLTPQVRFNIANCEEHLGKLALALGDYKLTATEAQDAGLPQVSAQASEHAESLGQRLSHVVVRRGAGAEFSTIALDGVTLGNTTVGVGLPVDPGPHSVEARAPGFNVFTNSFTVGERETKTIEVTLARSTGSSASEKKPLATTLSSGLEDDDVIIEPPHNRSVTPYVVGGIGAASVLTSGVFLLLRQGVLNDLDAQCGPNHNLCPASSVDLFDKGKAYTTAANITFVTGVLALGAGTVLYFAQKSSSSDRASSKSQAGALVVPTAASGRQSGSSLGVTVVGRF